MHPAKIISIATSQDQPCYCWHHRGYEHAGGNTVTVRVKLPKTSAHDGFPLENYHVTATPNQACSVHVTNKDKYGFDVVLTSPDATPLVKGNFSVMVIA
jgi:hypothetical protein